MIVLVQRVARASVVADGQATGAIGRGLLALVGLAAGDTDADLCWMAEKLPALRIFPDDQGKMNLSVAQVGGGILLVPNFTLCAATAKGNRPSFTGAMPPDRARLMFKSFVDHIAATGIPTAAGLFGADMKVELLNDGPVTLILDSAAASAARPREPGPAAA